MTDLIERIENYIQHVRPFTEDGQLFCEVQDEIERLREQLTNCSKGFDVLQNDIKDADARVEKLEVVVEAAHGILRAEQCSREETAAIVWLKKALTALEDS